MSFVEVEEFANQSSVGGNNQQQEVKSFSEVRGKLTMIINWEPQTHKRYTEASKQNVVSDEAPRRRRKSQIKVAFSAKLYYDIVRLSLTSLRASLEFLISISLKFSAAIALTMMSFVEVEEFANQSSVGGNNQQQEVKSFSSWIVWLRYGFKVYA